MPPKKQTVPTTRVTATVTRRTRCQHCGKLKLRSELKRHEAHCSMRGKSVVDESNLKTAFNFTEAETPRTYTQWHVDQMETVYRSEKAKLEQTIVKQKNSLSAMRESLHYLFRAVASAMEIINE